MDQLPEPPETVQGNVRRPRMGAREMLTPAQAKVLAIVEEDPGCSIRKVAIRHRVSHATASYHLFALAKLGLVVQVRDGREVLHFPDAGARSDAYLRVLMRDPRKAAILALLASHAVERMTIHQMTQLTGVPFAFLKRTLQQLATAGFVTLERRRYRYSVRVNPARRAEFEGIAGARQQP